MVGHSFVTALLSTALLSSAVDALGTPGHHLVNVFREQYQKGIKGGVDFHPPEKNEFDVPIMASNSSNSTLTKNYVDMPIDHFADCSDTYQNRYWVQEQWYKPGGPVFVMDGGESDGSFAVSYLRGFTFFTEMLKEFGGMGIVWEHRFYGKSIPDQQNRTFLTVEQALADIPAMAAKFSRPNFSQVDLTPAGTPWVFIGASYPGVRAAMSREKYPEIFQASWAASAPVQLRGDMSAYWSPIIPGMKALNRGGCLADIQAANKKMEKLLADEATAKPLKVKFFTKDNADMSNHEFAYSLSHIFYSWQSMLAYGEIGSFCDRLEFDEPNNKTAPAEGWAPTRGADYVIDRLAASGAFAPSSPISTVYESESWMWQYCSQLGFLQGSGPELDGLVIKYNSVSWHEQECQRAFPDEMPKWPQTKALNADFGGWNMRPSNTFWTAGEFDPWRTLSTLSDLPHAPKVEATTEVPQCGCSTDQDKVFGGILPQSGHGYEFGASESAQEMQKLFTKALKQWLPCFEKKSPSEIDQNTPGKCSKVPVMHSKRAVSFSS